MIKKDLFFCLNYFREVEYFSTLSSLCNNRLVLNNCTSYYALEYYGTDKLWEFYPSYDICNSFLSKYPQQFHSDILKCCIMFHYNYLFFKYKPNYFSYDFYESSAKCNNKEVYNYLHSIKPIEFNDLELKFNYKFFLGI